MQCDLPTQLGNVANALRAVVEMARANPSARTTIEEEQQVSVPVAVPFNFLEDVRVRGSALQAVFAGNNKPLTLDLSGVKCDDIIAEMFVVYFVMRTADVLVSLTSTSIEKSQKLIDDKRKAFGISRSAASAAGGGGTADASKRKMKSKPKSQ